MNTPVTPRRFHHRGRIVASALLFDTAHRHRLAQHWRPGCWVHAVEGGWVLGFDVSRPLHTDASPGLPLVRVQGRLLGAPLEPDEIVGHPGHVLVVRGGVVVDLGPGTPVSLHEHVALPTARTARGLTAPAPPPTPIVAQVEPEAVFAETIGTREVPAPPTQLTTSPSWSARLLDTLRSVMGGTSRTSTDASEAPARRGPKNTRRPEREAPGLMERLDSWLAQRAARMGLHTLLGRAHAKYLDELVDLLEGSKLDEALKKAIPLGNDRSPSGESSLAGWLRPQARDDLSYSPRNSGTARSIIPAADQTRQRLERAYEQARRTLEQSGRYEEAAYVLGELLGRPGEAVALLERHGLFERAAELAMAKELKPGLQVRLQIQAGHIDQAEALARRHDAFAEAVAELQRQDLHAEATRFRLLWANRLARSGAFRAAVLAMPRETWDREAVRPWIDAALQAGGRDGGEMLADVLDAAPHRFEELLPIAQQILDAPTHHGAEGILRQLEGRHPSDALRALAAAANRRLRCTTGVPGSAAFRAHRDTLHTLAPLQSADSPASLPEPVPAIREPEIIGSHDRGRLPVLDATVLPRGQLLVAHGESGVGLYDFKGTLQQHWPGPCHELVPSFDGSQALLLTRRGRLTLVDTLSLDTGTRSHWQDVEITLHARWCSDLWFVTTGSRLHAINRSSPDWRSAWSVDLAEPIQEMAIDRTHLGVRTSDRFQYAHHRRIVLRSRREDREPEQALMPTGGATPIVWPTQVDAAGSEPPRIQRIQATATPDLLVVANPLVYVSGPNRSLFFTFQGALHTTARIDAELLVAGDNLGRLRVVSLRDGSTLADLRMS